jgi:hypothetical protein
LRRPASALPGERNALLGYNNLAALAAAAAAEQIFDKYVVFA